MYPAPVGGGGGSTNINQNRTVSVTWAMPAGAPNPSYFQVLLFTGSDPTNTANQLATGQTVDGTARSMSLQMGVPAAGISALNAAVRAVWP